MMVCTTVAAVAPSMVGSSIKKTAWPSPGLGRARAIQLHVLLHGDGGRKGRFSADASADASRVLCLSRCLSRPGRNASLAAGMVTH